MTLLMIIAGLVISCDVVLDMAGLIFLSVDYPYINDLLELDSQRQVQVSAVPPILSGCRTPLEWREWDQSLREHPDKKLCVVCCERNPGRLLHRI